MVILKASDILSSATQRRNAVRHYFKEAEWKSRSGTSMLTELRAGGLGIRSSDFFKIRRDILGLSRYEEQIKGLRPDTLVPKSWYTDTHGLSLSKRFQYRAEITGIDPATGKRTTKILTVISDQLQSPGAVEREIDGFLRADPDLYQVTDYQVKLFRAYQRPS